MRWDTLCTKCFHFYIKKKEHNFQKNENFALLHISRKKNIPYLPELTKVFSVLLSLSKDFYSKIKCIGATLTVASFAAFVWSRHTTPSIPRRRPNNGCERDHSYCRSSNRENQHYLSLEVFASKIEFHLILLRKANGKIFAQPHTTLCIQFLDRENNDKNNTLPLGKQICFTIVWGCAEILLKRAP